MNFYYNNNFYRIVTHFGYAVGYHGSQLVKIVIGPFATARTIAYIVRNG